ncbi:hypothetical protein LPW26_04440 [Rhodopseudomonas sp. HC1]|uniref:hypothetical protein n=1 Tax=Rhodopseudomonas infernalis TaxID=2897386 RepID=UPI001EE93393|nr:hypothetical protein [Rhodopseudomonas infernalis]MCG6203876.1 hypothetical protein [Rhodopseudomonas infernalis]
MIDKLPKLVEALGKLGPSVTALAASIVFMAFAVYVVTHQAQKDITASPPKGEQKSAETKK